MDRETQEAIEALQSQVNVLAAHIDRLTNEMASETQLLMLAQELEVKLAILEHQVS